MSLLAVTCKLACFIYNISLGTKDYYSTQARRCHHFMICLPLYFILYEGTPVPTVATIRYITL